MATRKIFTCKQPCETAKHSFAEILWNFATMVIVCDIFKKSIHNRRYLSNDSKLCYLTNQFEGEASMLLKDFNHTDDIRRGTFTGTHGAGGKHHRGRLHLHCAAASEAACTRPRQPRGRVTERLWTLDELCTTIERELNLLRAEESQDGFAPQPAGGDRIGGSWYSSIVSINVNTNDQNNQM